MEPRLNVVVSHPTAMKGVILDQETNVLNIYFRLRQNSEARSKQLGTNYEQMSYIPGSLRRPLRSGLLTWILVKQIDLLYQKLN